MRELFLIRHGLTLWNQAGRVQGQSDIPLSEAGELQARALGVRLAGVLQDVSPHASPHICSSPLSRAAVTAALAFPGHSVTEDARLKELDFGDFEGQTLAERLALPAWHSWSADSFATPAPGGESYRDLRLRAVAWLQSLPDVPVIFAVTHSGTIQMLLSHVLGLETPRWRKRFYLGHTGVTCLVWEDGAWLVERVNDTRHLDTQLDNTHSNNMQLDNRHLNSKDLDSEDLDDRHLEDTHPENTHPGDVPTSAAENSDLPSDLPEVLRREP